MARNFIYVVKPDKHLDRRQVQLGVANLAQVEILSGLSQGEIVAVNSVSPTPLRDGVLRQSGGASIMMLFRPLLLLILVGSALASAGEPTADGSAEVGQCG